MEKVNLMEKFAEIRETWSPKIVGELNGQHVKLAKLEGEFIWHHHAAEDELFLVLQGNLRIHLRGGRARRRRALRHSSGSRAPTGGGRGCTRPALRAGLHPEYGKRP